MKTSEKAQIKKTAITRLLETLKPGQTVFCTLRHVSASGMQRRISLHVIKDDEIFQIDHLAARAMGDRIHDKGGIVVNGCGMDMGFSLVYNLGLTLWPNGTLAPHGSRNGEPDSDGGYALKSRWI